MCEALDDHEGSVCIGGRLITNFRFADDIVVNAEEEEEDGVLVDRLHPAGDMTRVSVVSRKDTVKIGDDENRCRGCRDKNRRKKAKILFRLVLFRVPFKSGV